MTSKKGLKDFDENLKKAGSMIGQLFARSQKKLEETGKQAIKTATELVETVSQTAEKNSRIHSRKDSRRHCHWYCSQGNCPCP